MREREEDLIHCVSQWLFIRRELDTLAILEAVRSYPE